MMIGDDHAGLQRPGTVPGSQLSAVRRATGRPDLARDSNHAGGFSLLVLRLRVGGFGLRLACLPASAGPRAGLRAERAKLQPGSSGPYWPHAGAGGVRNYR